MKKRKKNDFSIKALIGTFTIVLGLILVFLFLNSIVPFRKYEIRALMLNSFLLSIILSTTLALISMYLMYIYLKDYLELKSKFTLGILFAIISFFLFSITSNPLLHIILGIRDNIGIFSFIPMIFAMISLIILAWISSK